MDLIYRTVQVLREKLYWIRISAQEVGLMEPVKSWDKGQLNYITDHGLYIKCTCVPNMSSSVYRICKNIKTDQLLLWGGVIYLKTTVFTFR